jgi:LPXTG-motif cell wall-anchored protein
LKRAILTYAVLPLAAAAGAVFVVAGPVAAAGSVCKTATTTLTDRPDSGLHGDWAKDTFTRTVKLCETGPVEAAAAVAIAARSSYTATVTDAGTFTTVAGKSPDAGVDLAAGITGYLAGGFTATFTAEAGFKHYGGVFDGKTYSGTAPSTTGDWVKNLWGGGDFTSVTNLVAWKWTYWTCGRDEGKAVEKWVNVEAGNRGDITGKACPSPSPSASATASASTGPTAGASPSTGGTAGGLPVTGSNTGMYAGGGVVLLAAGAGLYLATRRRRREFSA